MSNITTLVGTQWYGGLPFADPTNTTGIASIVAYAEQILGDNLMALQLGSFLFCFSFYYAISIEAVLLS